MTNILQDKINYSELFLLQKKQQQTKGSSTYSQRIAKLNALKHAIEFTFRDAILEALAKDLGKPKVEAELSEIFQILGDIKFVKRHLKGWIKKQHVPTPLSLLGSSSYYIYQPKGVCLIVSPWNFPFNLTFGPLISAIAAGNRAIIKPSEISPNASALIKKIVEIVFSKDEVAVVDGGVAEAQALLELPFNHIFFTGSPQVGKIVMAAAAKHLASVTLELGGKSPTIIDKTANIDMAAKKIMWGKFMNCGQICVAPDYILIDEIIQEVFIEACKKWLHQFFTAQPESSKDYGKIISHAHFERLKAHLDLAKSLGAKIECGGNCDATLKYVSPTLVTNLPNEASLLQDEIFGPILPIVTFANIKEALDFINEKPQPLALYIYSKSQNNIKTIIENTSAGGTCINNNVLHYANHHLPFGGVNHSGIGRSHGFYGFKAFSNERAVLKQHTFGVTELLFPPYSNFKTKLAKFTIKWF